MPIAEMPKPKNAAEFVSSSPSSEKKKPAKFPKKPKGKPATAKPAAEPQKRSRSKNISFRVTPDFWARVEKHIEVSGLGLTSFIIVSLTERMNKDRDLFGKEF